MGSSNFSKFLAIALLGTTLSAAALPAQAGFWDRFRTSPARPAQPTPAQRSAARGSTLDTMLEMTNRERGQAGLGRLTVSSELAIAAQKHAEDMARSGEVSHTGSDGSTMGDRITASGYAIRRAGENIYMQAPRNRAERVVPGWMNSQGHRDNLLNGQFTEVGFGYAQGNGRHYYVQVLGTPMAQAQTTASATQAPARPTRVTPTPTSQTPISQTPISQNKSQGDTVGSILTLTNQERSQQGLNGLSFSEPLNAAAQRHAQDMARSGQFSHEGSDGSGMGDRIQAAGYRLRMAGENIAYRAPQNDPAGAVQSWMKSQGHRDNILNGQFTDIGIGYATDGNRHYYVQVFGRPR